MVVAAAAGRLQMRPDFVARRQPSAKRCNGIRCARKAIRSSYTNHIAPSTAAEELDLSFSPSGAPGCRLASYVFK